MRIEDACGTEMFSGVETVHMLAGIQHCKRIFIKISYQFAQMVNSLFSYLVINLI